MNKWIFLLFLFAAVTAPAQVADHIDDKGEQLKKFYLGLHVEQLWLPGQHVNWETGEPDSPDATENIKTHCSIFAAAACKRLNIYLLRPPDARQTLLANAQYDWLHTDSARSKGWIKIEGMNIWGQAQERANKGYVVVAICKNPDPERPGHTALILPAVMFHKVLADAGPRLIMAGAQNHDNVSLYDGFARHMNGWPPSNIDFFYNTNMPF